MKRIFRPLTVRPVLSLSFAGGFAVAAFLPGLFAVERLLAGWCLATLLFVVVASYRLGRLNAADIKRHVNEHDEGAVIILCLGMAATAASFAGVAYELHAMHGTGTGAGLIALPLMVGTILCSWFFIHTVFAIHYASLYYSGIPPEPEKTPGEKGAVALVFHKKEIRFSGVLSEPEKHPLKKARSRLFFNGRHTRILK